jgi:adenylate cyclase
MFVDIRDFTPFAESNTAEDTVARLNALFEIVVPAVVEAGGHAVTPFDGSTLSESLAAHPLGRKDDHSVNEKMAHA